ncbi:MAG: T9SS type A sorting domain-containing protein [Salibacteraceae bacterium]
MKLVSTLIALMLIVTIQAQETIESNYSPNLINHSYSSRADSDTLSAWLNYGRIIYDLQGDRSYFRNYLYPDSTVVLEFSSGYSNVWKHSFGQVLDPKSVWFATEGISVKDTTLYSLDSVGVRYRYFRWNDSIPDTLVVQIYDKSLVRNRTTTWQSGASYANVGYDYLKRKGETPIKEIRYLLENKDTALFGSSKLLKFPVGLSLDTGLVAATVTYFPGIPANLGDTIDAYNPVNVTNKVNAFLVYEFRDEVPYVHPDEFNNGLSVTQSVRYNENTNGWNGRYQPGTSWASASGIYHFDMDFHITYIKPKPVIKPTGIAENNNDKVSVYPNPASNVLNIENLAGYSQISLVNSIGEVVLSEKINYSSNQFDVSNLPSGIYVLQLITENGENHKERIVIQQ